MTHYARTPDNRSLIDIESSQIDLECVVDIMVYTNILLSMPMESQLKFMEDVYHISEIRGFYFEHPCNKNKTATQVAKEELKKFCSRWQFSYVED